jgi:hypothetical protein
MASSYSADLKLELMVTGEKSGLWGDITNDNLTILQQAIAGYEAISIAGGAQTTALTFSNGLVSNGKNAVIKLTGTITGNQVVTIPDSIEKTYIIENGTTGAFTVEFKTVSGTGTTFSTTDKGIKILFADGTNIVDVNANLSEITLSTPLAPSSGGTGLSSPGASGNVLVSNGSAWTSGTGIPTGVIFLWSGSIASIPAGFALCDGTSGTPDLRNRFLVGAGSTYAVNATGGSADAIVVSHNHSITDPGHTHVLPHNLPQTLVDTDRGNQPSAFSLDDIIFTPSVNAALTGITINNAGSSGTNANLPPYFALAYIMKL